MALTDSTSRSTNTADLLKKHGISLQSTAPGRYYTVCPKCSATRKLSSQSKKCLGITIDGADANWGCNHCGWTGPEKGSGNSRGGNSRTTCDYADASGAVTFQKVRAYDKDGKKFFWLQRPDGAGSWIKNTKGVDTKLIYRLPEVIGAQALDRTIVVVEGEKDTDALWTIGIPATCNAHGAAKPGQQPKWQPEHSEQLRGADIVIIPDNDPAGRAHAEAAASLSHGIAQRVRMLDLAKHWPAIPSGGDISDWLAAGHSREQLDALIAAAPDWSPPQAVAPDGTKDKLAEFDTEPVDLWGNFEPPMLPRGLLPKLIENYAFTQAETMGVDPGGVAMAALAVCAAATPDTIRLVMKRHTREWTESARLWVGLVGLPSTKKSPIISTTIRPLARLDAELLKRFLFELKLYEQMEKDERKKADKPVQKRLRLEDTTIEGAQEALAYSPNGVLMMQDELSGFFGAMDKYSGHRGAAKDRGFWLQSYNGGPYALNRIGRGAGIIPNLSVSLLGGIQPDVIRRLSTESYDDGFLQRMLLIVMRPAEAGKDLPMPNVSKEYSTLIERLTELRPPPTSDNSDVLRFDSNAQELRGSLEAEHLNLMQFEAVNRKLAAHIGKYDGLFGRLCVAFHCIKHAHDGHLPEVVIEDTATRVARFMREFLLPHALTFYGGILKLADDHDRLAAIAGYILARRKERMTNRDVQRGDRSMRGLTRRETEAIFEQLDALGWVTRTSGLRPSDPPHWIVNPVVHQKFAERGKAEAERRERDRAMIRGMLRRGTAL